MNTVICFGPPACGKTHHKELLMRVLGCNSVVDDWMQYKPVQRGALHLTFEHPDQFSKKKKYLKNVENMRIRIISFDDAMTLMDSQREDSK